MHSPRNLPQIAQIDCNPVQILECGASIDDVWMRAEPAKASRPLGPAACAPPFLLAYSWGSASASRTTDPQARCFQVLLRDARESEMATCFSRRDGPSSRPF
jgi:hypothetical protein